jgi:stress response protein YsnF
MEARIAKLEAKVIELENRLNSTSNDNGKMLKEQEERLAAAKQAALNAQKDAEWARMLAGLGKNY